MFAEFIIAILLGVFSGTITGLIPGLHVNMVAMFILLYLAKISEFVNLSSIIVFIISMAITHTFLDAIPAIFLGAPDADMVLSILPGHKMLLEGKGILAVRLTVLGSFLGLLSSLILVFISFFFLRYLYMLLERVIAYFLIAIVLFTILKEKSLNKFFALFVFLLAGTLGILTLNSGIVKNPLFVMLTGLFGVSSLFLSIIKKTRIPEQKDIETRLKRKDVIKSCFSSLIAGSFVALMPGIGSAQAAVIATEIFRKISDKAYLIIIGGVNTVNMLFSLATFYLLNKTRNGAIVAIKQIVGNINFAQLLLLLFSALVAGSLAVFLTLKISKKISLIFNKINYSYLCIAIILFLFIFVYFASGFIGLFILIISSALGLLPPLIGIRRVHLMGCLLLPVILYFLL